MGDIAWTWVVLGIMYYGFTGSRIGNTKLSFLANFLVACFMLAIWPVLLMVSLMFRGKQ